MKYIIMMFVALFSVTVSYGQVIRGKQILQISITGVPIAEQGRLNSTYPVSEDGYIEMWKIGRIKAAGASKAALATTIASRYKAAQIYTSPVFQVMSTKDAETTDNHVFTVGGQVRQSGPKQWTEGLTLYGAVQAAGGESPYGAINRVNLFRNGKRYVYNLKNDKHKSVKIYAKDIIEVPQKKWNGK